MPGHLHASYRLHHEDRLTRGPAARRNGRLRGTARHPRGGRGIGYDDQLTYTFPGEEERTLRNPDLPFERMGKRKGRVVVRLEGVHGELTCKIIVNGRQVKTATSNTGAALTCDHSMAV